MRRNKTVEAHAVGWLAIVFILGALVALLAGCDKAERITGPIWPPPRPGAQMEGGEGLVGADAIAGFEASFIRFAGWSIKNTGTGQRWAYAYYTSLDNQTAVLGSKTLLVNPGATWSNTFNKTCVQLDLSTEGVGGRPDIGYAYFDKRGNIITTANYNAAVAECRGPAPTPTPGTCTTIWENPNSNCQECSLDRRTCLVPR